MKICVTTTLLLAVGASLGRAWQPGFADLVRVVFTE